MDKCVRAIEVVPTGQPTVVLFTKGDKFIFDSLGNGETGNWKVGFEKIGKINKVMIYFREPNDIGGRIFLGTIVGFKEAEQFGRYIISFSNLEEVCATNSNWPEFASNSSNPVYYLN